MELQDYPFDYQNQTLLQLDLTRFETMDASSKKLGSQIASFPSLPPRHKLQNGLSARLALLISYVRVDDDSV